MKENKDSCGKEKGVLECDGIIMNQEMGNNGESYEEISSFDEGYDGNRTKTNPKPNEAKRNESYNRYVENVTPKNSCAANCFKAFITGGAICALGQFLIKMYMWFGIPKDDAALWGTITLVVISVILTGFNIYSQITAWGGAGSLVPITGFANSVAAPAIEYKAEGEVFGIGCKIFTIAGPVILYGVIVSFVLGILYYLQIAVF